MAGEDGHNHEISTAQCSVEISGNKVLDVLEPTTSPVLQILNSRNGCTYLCQKSGQRRKYLFTADPKIIELMKMCTNQFLK